MSVQIISTLPPAPQSGDDSDTIETKCNTLFQTGLPGMITECNQFGEDVQAVGNTCTAIANFKGAWEDLTGALNMPASVFHEGSYYALLADLADVTTEEPGTSTSWSSLSVMQPRIEYSEDGAADWHETYTVGDSYMRVSTDGGSTWSAAMMFVGSDGADADLDDAEFTGYVQEEVYALTGTAINPANGTVQTKTITGNTTFSQSLSSGQSVTLLLTDADDYTITWPTITWPGGSDPTMTGLDLVELVKIGSTVFGSHIGYGS